ncbi:MAG TPA: radical SAM protein [Bacteroidales bacterium]|nr:radical SAM protein [Bacteroidales bacterium]HXK82204.1 radical SAM protein [Bacteroidales bacterium]
MYKYLFGPVPSRRLGMSLGVDLVPRKVCSLDCVYCEVGKTSLLTSERKEYIKFENVKKELEDYFDKNQDPDFITFSGSGEPTLNCKIGKVLDFIKALKPNIPIAVLTNGTLLFNTDVRKEIINADLVLPSLDAVSQDVFNKINRPEKSLKIKDCIQGLIDFSKEFKGKIWLEVFILPGYNDNKNEIAKLREIILQINPDSIQLNTLDRPGTVSNLRGATRQELEHIAKLLNIDNINIIAAMAQRKKIKSFREDIENAIIETISRRPCTIDDIIEILGLHVSEINKYLDVLESENRVETSLQERGVFYKIKS